MEIELLGALDYKKIEDLLKSKGIDNPEVIEEIKNLEKYERTLKVATAGKLSRFPGSVFDILKINQEASFDDNVKFAKRVIKMGHDSITDHDYLVFAIKDVSPIIEQTIIAERFASFTIKSRREVDFSKVGFYTPNFHDKLGNLIEDNDKVREEYQEYMRYLFKKYDDLVKLGIPLEDARFVLPYAYHSNIMMGIDAHVLKDMIIKFTKTKYARISEIKEFGEKLKDIARENVPYIMDLIEDKPIRDKDEVLEYLNKQISNREYKILDKPKLISCSKNIDDTILIGAIMRRYQFSYDEAVKVYKNLKDENKEFSYELMRKIVFQGDKLELTQVNFQFQIPISFAVLTHLTRHRTHDILIPDFVPIVDLEQYKIPPKVRFKCLEEYEEIFRKNNEVFLHYNIREEDLIYFTLSGNMVNVVTNMNGKTLEHILRLRECTKAQWETREMAYGMHEELNKELGCEIFSKVLGPTCVTEMFCGEGKESCGRIKQILELKKKDKKARCL